MKRIICTILAFASFAVWAAPALSQRVTMNARKVTVSAALKQISETYGVKFTISPKVQLDKKISIDVKDAALKEVLNFLAEQEKFGWKIVADNSVQIFSLK